MIIGLLYASPAPKIRVQSAAFSMTTLQDLEGYRRQITIHGDRDKSTNPGVIRTVEVHCDLCVKLQVSLLGKVKREECLSV